MAYKRMWENKGHRPWWSVPHLAFMGNAVRDLTGFGYKKTIYVVTADMTNKAYFDVDEMKRAGVHFAKLYQDKKRVTALLGIVRDRFKRATQREQWAWKQQWNKHSDEALLNTLDLMHDLVLDILACMFLSQPQHVIFLEEKIATLLEKTPNTGDIVRAVTYYRGAMPWTKEKAELKKWHSRWKQLSSTEKTNVLDHLIKTYGWFNSIEGDRAFDREHYRKEIETFHDETAHKPKKINVSKTVLETGRLIGELGHLRFWTRWHFMHIRYHMKMALAELAKRGGHPDLPFATIEEVRRFFRREKIDWSGIRKRRQGWVSILNHDQTTISFW